MPTMTKQKERKVYQYKIKTIQCVVCEIYGEGSAKIPFKHANCRKVRAKQKRAEATKLRKDKVLTLKCVKCHIELTGEESKDGGTLCAICQMHMPEAKQRVCLKCDRVFKSRHNGNRRCPACCRKLELIESAYVDNIFKFHGDSDGAERYGF